VTRNRSELLAAGVLLLLLGLTALVYWPGLSGGMMLDDLSNLMPLKQMAQGGFTWSQVVASNMATLGRPVSMLTFVANWLSTGSSLWALKYTNLMLHLITGLLICWLTGRLLDQPEVGLREQRWWVAVWTAAVWLLAPLLASTVLYIIQRMAQLSALFVVVGLLCYVIGRQNIERDFGRGAALILAAFAVFWPLATFSKENGSLLPLLALVVEAWFFRFQAVGRARRFVVAVLVTGLALPAVGVAVKLALDPGWMTRGYAYRDFTLGERLLTETRILFDYVGQLLVPRGAVMGVYHDDYVKSTGLLSPPTTLLSVVGWAAVLAAAWWTRNGRARWLLFGPVFFLAAQALESSVFPLELYFEHRNYLPAYGIFLSAAVGAWYVWQSGSLRRMVVVVLLLLPVGYAAATYQRAVLWRSPEAIRLASGQMHPDSRRVHAELASVYFNAGQLDKALHQLALIEGLYPGGRSSAAALHRLLGYCSLHRDIPESAYAALARLDRLDGDTYTVNVLRDLTRSLGKGQCPQLDWVRVAEVTHRLLQAAGDDMHPNIEWALHISVASLLLTAGRPEVALIHTRAAHRLFADRLDSDLIAFQAHMEQGDIKSARKTLARLEANDRHTMLAHTRAIEAFSQLMERVDELATPTATRP
jgi:tetratricopeptide (TPR) repeat protein